MKKKLVSLALAAAMVLSVSASAFAGEAKSANADPVNTETSDETIVIALSAEPSGLWGAGVGKVENEMQIIGAPLLDTLVISDKNTGEILPNLATSWEWIDETHCRFVLRDDVTMSDGTPLVADDVVYSVNTWIEFSGNTDTGRFLEGASAEDEHTVTIGFNTVAPDFLAMMAWSNFGIVSEDEVNALGGPEAANTNPAFGSGKYRFKEWNHGSDIVLERNDNYWNPDYKGYYKEIRFIFTNDAAARAMAVQSGDVQVAYDMPMSMASTYVADDSVQVIAHTFGQNTRIWYNMGPNAGPTADIRVRQAIDKALNFDAIAMVGTAGFGEEVHGTFPAESRYYNEIFTKEERAVDIEGAKALLEEAGYGDGLDLSIVGMQDQNPVFTVMQENLKQAGINLSIQIVDTPQFVEQANGGTYDIIHVGDLQDARYPTIFSSLRQALIDTFCIGGCKYTTPEIEEMIDSVIQEPDEEKAKENAKTLEEYLKQEMMISNTYPEMHAAITGADIKGYRTMERGFLDATGFYK